MLKVKILSLLVYNDGKKVHFGHISSFSRPSVTIGTRSGQLATFQSGCRSNIAEHFRFRRPFHCVKSSGLWECRKCFSVDFGTVPDCGRARSSTEWWCCKIGKVARVRRLTFRYFKFKLPAFHNNISGPLCDWFFGLFRSENVCSLKTYW